MIQENISLTEWLRSFTGQVVYAAFVFSLLKHDIWVSCIVVSFCLFWAFVGSKATRTRTQNREKQIKSGLTGRWSPCKWNQAWPFTCSYRCFRPQIRFYESLLSSWKKIYFRVITRIFRVITRIFRVITRIFRVITRIFRVITRNFRIITRMFRVITRNFRIITRIYLLNATKLSHSTLDS